MCIIIPLCAVCPYEVYKDVKELNNLIIHSLNVEQTHVRELGLKMVFKVMLQNPQVYET